MDTLMTWSFRLPAVPASVPQVRHGVRAALEPTGFEGANVELAVSEAVSNAVRHGYRECSGAVEVELLVDDTVVEVVVHDDGVGPQPHPGSGGAGMGFVLMQSLADRFELEGGPGAGTTVRMQFALVSPS
jgi:stage II sporulation protein AB (anti-sigma F factor)